MTTTIVTGSGGLQFDAEIRSHIVPTDQPITAGGTDSAAMPLELLYAALGTCVAYYTHKFLVSRGLPVAGLRVEVTPEPLSGHPKRIGHFDIRIELPEGIPAEMVPLIERVARTCPVHNTLAHSPDIAVEIVAPHLVGG